MSLKREFETQGNWLFRYRSILPIALLAIALAVFIQSNLAGKTATECITWVELLCLLVSFIGLAIRVYTVGHSARRTSGRNTHEGQVADSLNITGAYSIVRHPLYVGNFFMWLGPALLSFNFWFIISFVLFYWIYYERIMYAEEQFLEKKFGRVYLDWAAKVPAFIPNAFLFRRPDLSFSIKKVLRKEKNGLFALFLVFAFFDIAGELLLRHDHYNRVFVIGTVFTMILYIILKILKHRPLLSDNR